MIFLNPYLPPAGMAKLYSSHESRSETNPRLATYYERLEGSETERFFDECVEKMGRCTSLNSHSLLDVGAGNGHFLWRAKQKGWTVRGIEPSEEDARLAREKFQIEIISQDFENYSPHETFDCITMWDFIEHVPNPKEILEKANALLKPGGLLLVATPDHTSLINFLADLIYKISFLTIPKPLEVLFVREHILYFTDSTIRKVVRESGFEIVEEVKTGTDIDRYRTSWLFNVTAKVLLILSKWFHRENRIIIFARKRQE